MPYLDALTTAPNYPFWTPKMRYASFLMCSRRCDDLSPQEFEKALSQCLYTYIRAGDIETAIDICSVVDQPWRSAAMRGAQAFSWRLLGRLLATTSILDIHKLNHFPETNAEPDDDAMDEDPAVSEGCRGNVRRKLWRKSCQTAATSVRLTAS